MKHAFVLKNWKRIKQQNPLPSKTTALLSLALVTGFQLQLERPNPAILSHSHWPALIKYAYFLLTRKLQATAAPVSHPFHKEVLQLSEGKKTLKKPFFFRQMDWLSNKLIKVCQLNKRWSYRGAGNPPLLSTRLSPLKLHTANSPGSCWRREGWGARPCLLGSQHHQGTCSVKQLRTSAS